MNFGGSNKGDGGGESPKQPRLPGMMQHLSYDQVHMMLCSLRASYQVSQLETVKWPS